MSDEITFLKCLDEDKQAINFFLIYLKSEVNCPIQIVLITSSILAT